MIQNVNVLIRNTLQICIKCHSYKKIKYFEIKYKIAVFAVQFRPYLLKLRRNACLDCLFYFICQYSKIILIIHDFFAVDLQKQQAESMHQRQK